MLFLKGVLGVGPAFIKRKTEIDNFTVVCIMVFAANGLSRNRYACANAHTDTNVRDRYAV